MFELRAGVIERQSEDDEWRHTSSVIPETTLYGRDQDKEKIVEFLLKQSSDNGELSVYPIVGIGGLGKTTLAQLVLNDERVSQHFDLRIWVCVSDDFSVKNILQSIIECTTLQNPNLSNLESLQKKVQDVLLSRRYLLVLDDVWNEEQVKWEELKSVLQCGTGQKGVSILVTTRLENVASIMGTCPAHLLSGLSEDDSWSLFKHHAFGPSREEKPELVTIGKDIISKCAGSPLASKALGSLLRSKREEKQWLSVKESKFWDLPEDNHIMRALRLSYFNLKLSLRRCFSFCAIFPQDFEFVKEQLVHLWMANGFIKSRGNLEVEDVGNEVWNELYQRSFFQEVKIDAFGDMTFKMHDLFHKLAESIMGEECVVSTDASLPNLPSRVHHIGLLDSDQPVNATAFKKVESLRTFVEIYPSPVDEKLYQLPSISPLRALCTSTSQLSTLKNLTHLRYLNIHGSYVTTLPESVCRLQKLQILKLERCRCLYCLPKHLTRLQDLRHLVIKECDSLIAMPPNIGKLTCLKRLSMFIVNSKAGFGLAELHDLQLGGKLHISGLESVKSECDAKQANLANKKELNRIYLSWGDNASSQDTDIERILEALEPPSNLKSLGLNGYWGVQLPSWMRNTSIMEGLVQVIISECKNCERLPPFGKLLHLTTLYVSGMNDVKYIDDDSYKDFAGKAFKCLKKLIMKSLPNLEGMLGDEVVEMLPLLSELSISKVPKFKLPCLPSIEHPEARDIEDEASFIEGIVQNLPCLKTLCLDGLNVFPNEIGSLSELQKLKIWSCHELESLPGHGLHGLTSLRTMEICNCPKLKSLSEGMGHLSCLEHLQIAECPQLVSLPSNMNQLTALHQVGIMFIQNYGTLPEGLQHIPSLQSLLLCGIYSLPDWLGDMTSLQQLQISSSPELTSLPSSFRHLTNLQMLSIYECPKLEKQWTKKTGEEWQKIAHVPLLNIYNSKQRTVSENIRSKRNEGNRCIREYMNIYQHACLPYDFRAMVDESESESESQSDC